MTGAPGKTQEKDGAADLAKPGINHLFRSLTNTNFQLYFSGQLISLIGTWMQQLAMSWLVYTLTQSPLLLGVVAFASQAPSFLIGPFAGILPDRLNRHKLIICTQSLLMMQAFVLAYLALTGHVQVWELIALGAFSGIVNAVDMPTRQAFVVDMVDSREDMANAIALNAALMNLTRLIGPALAGFVIAWLGEGMCFLINAVSFIAVIWALMLMKIDHKPRALIDEFNLFSHLKEGFIYAFGFAPIRVLLIVAAVTSLAAMPYMVLMPAFVKDIFHGNAQTLGLIMAASSVGALLGTLLLAARKSILGLGKWLCGSIIIFAIALMVFAVSKNMALSIVAVAVSGFGMMIEMAAANIILQTIVEEDKRGRVMSIYMMCFMGLAPFGALIGGAAANVVGVAAVLFGGGVACLLLVLWSLTIMPKLRHLVRPLYIERGILPRDAD